MIGFTIGGCVTVVAGYAGGVAWRWTRDDREVNIHDVGHLGVVALGALGVAAISGYLYWTAGAAG